MYLYFWGVKSFSYGICIHVCNVKGSRKSTKPKLVVVALKLKRDICMCIIISLYIMCFDEVKKLAHDLRKNK